MKKKTTAAKPTKDAVKLKVMTAECERLIAGNRMLLDRAVTAERRIDEANRILAGYGIGGYRAAAMSPGGKELAEEAVEALKNRDRQLEAYHNREVEVRLALERIGLIKRSGTGAIAELVGQFIAYRMVALGMKPERPASQSPNDDGTNTLAVAG